MAQDAAARTRSFATFADSTLDVVRYGREVVGAEALLFARNQDHRHRRFRRDARHAPPQEPR